MIRDRETTERGGPLDKSQVRRGWLVYIAVMLAFYVLIKIFGDQTPPASEPAQPPTAAATKGVPAAR